MPWTFPTPGRSRRRKSMEEKVGLPPASPVRQHGSISSGEKEGLLSDQALDGMRGKPLMPGGRGDSFETLSTQALTPATSTAPTLRRGARAMPGFGVGGGGQGEQKKHYPPGTENEAAAMRIEAVQGASLDQTNLNPNNPLHLPQGAALTPGARGIVLPPEPQSEQERLMGTQQQGAQQPNPIAALLQALGVPQNQGQVQNPSAGALGENHAVMFEASHNMGDPTYNGAERPEMPSYTAASIRGAIEEAIDKAEALTANDVSKATEAIQKVADLRQAQISFASKTRRQGGIVFGNIAQPFIRLVQWRRASKMKIKRNEAVQRLNTQEKYRMHIQTLTLATELRHLRETDNVLASVYNHMAGLGHAPTQDEFQSTVLGRRSDERQLDKIDHKQDMRIYMASRENQIDQVENDKLLLKAQREALIAMEQQALGRAQLAQQYIENLTAEGDKTKAELETLQITNQALRVTNALRKLRETASAETHVAKEKQALMQLNRRAEVLEIESKNLGQLLNRKDEDIDQDIHKWKTQVETHIEKHNHFMKMPWNFIEPFMKKMLKNGLAMNTQNAFHGALNQFSKDVQRGEQKDWLGKQLRASSDWAKKEFKVTPSPEFIGYAAVSLLQREKSKNITEAVVLATEFATKAMLKGTSQDDVERELIDPNKVWQHRDLPLIIKDIRNNYAPHTPAPVSMPSVGGGRREATGQHFSPSTSADSDTYGEETDTKRNTAANAQRAYQTPRRRRHLSEVHTPIVQRAASQPDDAPKTPLPTERGFYREASQSDDAPKTPLRRGSSFQSAPKTPLRRGSSLRNAYTKSAITPGRRQSESKQAMLYAKEHYPTQNRSWHKDYVQATKHYPEDLGDSRTDKDPFCAAFADAKADLNLPKDDEYIAVYASLISKDHDEDTAKRMADLHFEGIDLSNAVFIVETLNAKIDDFSGKVSEGFIQDFSEDFLHYMHEIYKENPNMLKNEENIDTAFIGAEYNANQMVAVAQETIKKGTKYAEEIFPDEEDKQDIFIDAYVERAMDPENDDDDETLKTYSRHYTNARIIAEDRTPGDIELQERFIKLYVDRIMNTSPSDSEED